MKKVSKSFLTGAVALVFAVLGYQSALLVHYSAVSRIEANRDEPDTVYIYVERAQQQEAVARNTAREYADSENRLVTGHRQSAGNQTGSGERTGSWEQRHKASHSDLAAQVRQKLPPRKIETFRFNPNTADAEDFVRLGFSPKQAQSLVSYRNKGGRFRRKEDFADSYVVSDSIYRRLEPYIDIPLLDINKADSAAFDSLPGIGAHFASKMLAHRKALHGYSCKEQLLDIYNFGQERFDKIADLISVSPPEPYRLWTLPADSLRLHPYIRTAAVARSIVFFRSHNPPSAYSVEALREAGIISAEYAGKLSLCLLEEP